MSMWLDVVVMSEKAFDAVRQNGELLGDVFQQEAAALSQLGVATSDLSGCDYRTIAEAITAMNEATGEDEDGEADFKEEGSLEWEGTYGPAMFWSPKTLAKALEDSSAWAMALELESEIKAIADRAVKEQLWVIAVIN